VSLAAACTPRATLAPVPATTTTGPGTELTVGEVAELRLGRRYFTLRDRLAQARDSTSAAALYARAILEHAMNRPAASNVALARLRAVAGLRDSVIADAWELEISNDLRLADYAAGSRAIDSLLTRGSLLDSVRTADAHNTERIFRALTGTSPQTMVAAGPSEVRITKGHIPMVINDSARDYVFDTGANLSTIMRSEATALGLRIIPAGLDVGSSTNVRVTADLGIADSLRIGAMHFHNVVFLVLDDALLTFPDGFRIPGIIGFPVIEQMGEVRLRRTSLVVPATPPLRTEHNLLLDELTLLTLAHWEGRPMLCRLDTGAGPTQVYEPFYRRFRAAIDAVSDTATRKMGGAGGVVQTPVRVVSNARLATGGTVATLKTLDVLVNSIARDEIENYLDCNLGHDVFDQFGEMVVNFRDMAFLLR
jgi:predicted aspartyl protease